MKLDLKKSQLVNLSYDNQVLPNDLTPQIGGGNNCTCGCCPTPTTPAAGCPVGPIVTQDFDNPRCGTLMSNPPPGYQCY